MKATNAIDNDEPIISVCQFPIAISGDHSTRIMNDIEAFGHQDYSKPFGGNSRVNLVGPSCFTTS